MPGTLELCEQFFGTKNIYEVFEITKDANEKEVKKAYYKISLKVHPDRVVAEQKELATEKFKLLAKLYNIINDKDRKALYDEKNIIHDEDSMGLSSIIEFWRRVFKPITDEDIDNYRLSYIGSDTEMNDIRKAYLAGKGCINYMLSSIPFMEIDDEPRIIEIVKKWIADDEVPEYKNLTDEPSAKRKRRHNKYNREAREAKFRSEQSSLTQTIAVRRTERASQFLDLLKKYGNDNGEITTSDDEVPIPDPRKKQKLSGNKKKKNVKESPPKAKRSTNGQSSASSTSTRITRSKK